VGQLVGLMSEVIEAGIEGVVEALHHGVMIVLHRTRWRNVIRSTTTKATTKLGREITPQGCQQEWEATAMNDSDDESGQQDWARAGDSNKQVGAVLHGSFSSQRRHGWMSPAQNG
jgi:hypothetical protein